MDLINFMIDNCFILRENIVHQLIIGIHTGKNCAADLANIFLHIFEKMFVENLINDKNEKYLELLGTTFRYQDDLITFGNYTTRDKLFLDIYPNDMVIHNTNKAVNHLTYLDLDIIVEINKFIYKSYDKRNDFNFPIINYPNLHGNIPVKAAYGVFTSQLLRYARINLNIGDLIKDIKKLVNKLLKQGYKKLFLRITYKRFTIKYIAVWARFGVDISHNNFIKNIFH